jgi:arylsulfatase A-like enzyme
LLVVIDTLRADAVSAYGVVGDTTPAFDTLAAEGLLYGHAFAPSPWTLPSHASLFSGLRVDRHGVGFGGRMSLPSELTTIAERLRDAGYATAGYSENPLVSAPFGMDQGFEQFAAVSTDEILKRSGKSGGVQFDIVAEITAFATQRDRSRPYFLFANLLDAHAPYQAREINRFLPPSVSAGTVWPPSRLKQTADLICDRLPSPAEVEILHGLYLGGVAEADAKLGKIVEIARESRLAGGLIVVATSDHGEQFGEHRLLDHEFSVRAPVLNIPLAVHGLPDTKPGRIDAPVELADVAASVLHWAGIGIPPDLAGRPLPTQPSETARTGADLLAFYSDEPLSASGKWDRGRKPAMNRNAKREGCGSEDRVFGRMASLTRWPFKLIWFQRYPAELYNLSWDPKERSDLAALEPEVSAPLLEEIWRLTNEMGVADGTADEAATPSAAELEALRGLGYVE